MNDDIMNGGSYSYSHPIIFQIQHWIIPVLAFITQKNIHWQVILIFPKLINLLLSRLFSIIMTSALLYLRKYYHLHCVVSRYPLKEFWLFQPFLKTPELIILCAYNEQLELVSSINVTIVHISFLRRAEPYLPWRLSKALNNRTTLFNFLLVCS